MTRYLPAGILGYACGRDHTCPIKHIRVGAGALQALAEVCAEYTRALWLYYQYK